MAVEIQRPTVRVANIPLTATAQDLISFLESVLGKGSIFALEIFTYHKNWKSKGHGRVQFETLESKAKAIDVSLQDKLVFKGSCLSLSPSHDDVVTRPVEPRNRVENGILHAGFMVSELCMCVIETWEKVKVWIMPERQCVQWWLESGGETYKLEILFVDIVEACGCYLDLDYPSAVLLKLKYAPKVYKRICGPKVTSRFSADRYHICKEDQGFLWIRTADVSSRLTIGKSFTFCCEVQEESVALDVFSCLPRYTNNLKDLNLEEWAEFSSELPSRLVPLVEDEALSKLDYEIVFQINSLIHTQKITIAGVDSDLINFISTLSVDAALVILQKLHKLTSICYDPLEFMMSQSDLLAGKQSKRLSPISRLINNNVMSCHRALITPTKIYLLGPELESSNYVVKNFASYASDFMRVTFVDEDWGRLQPHSISTNAQLGMFSKPLRTPIYHRILSILREGIVIGNKKFEFLAFSASQLRSNSVWMFASNENVKAEEIRQWMGSFTKIRSISKCAARMGQLFSSSKQTLVVPVQDVEVIPDIEVTTDGVNYCFSDGIGKISLSFARQVADKYGLDYIPSAFQIRYGGYKGVIAVDRNSFRKLSLRSSMLKFESNNRMLNVTKCSESLPCYLNREIITLLSTLGVKDESFEELLQEQMHLLGKMMSSREAALTVLESMGMVGKSILPKMLLHGYEPNKEPYLSMMLQAYCENQLYDTKYRCRLYVPKGRVLLGCLDETGVLNYGQVYVRITLTKSELEDGNQSYFQRVDDKTAIVKGKVVVTKNPCLHPGDVRVLEAVYELVLVEKNLMDCLIFPQKGQRPHPNECSGGDLDGDLYFISWDVNLIPPRTVPPMDYTGGRPRVMDHDVTAEEIQQFFVHYMVNDTLGAISTAHLVHADREPEKALSPKCLHLASLHSMAVDFAKNGAPAEMPQALRPREYPDFMERLEKPMYISEGVLGKLYRTLVAFLSDQGGYSGPTWTKEKVESIYDRDLEVPGFEAFVGPARNYKEMYVEKMNALIVLYGATHEVEILTGNLRRHSAYLQKDNRRYLEMKDRILESIKSLQREAKGWFDDSCKVQEKQKMASAWYHVTYNPAHWEDSTNCLSFPWVVGDILLNVKSANVINGS